MERFQQTRSASGKLREAGQHLETGSLAAAERAYRAVLTEQPGSPIACRAAVAGLRRLSSDWNKVSQNRSISPELRKAASEKSSMLRELADSFRA